MNIKVQAKAIELTAKTVNPFVIVKILGDFIVKTINYKKLGLPLFTKVLSIAGHSISAINPKFSRGETLAVYA
jgi:hypothetical protein